MRSNVAGIVLPWVLLVSSTAATAQTTGSPELVPIQWLEVAGPAVKGELPRLKEMASSDARVAQAERMLDNEAARFIRTVIAAAWRLTPKHRTGPLPPLPILFEQGGNYARHGFQLVEGEKVTAFDLPYVVLELDGSRLSLTLLHEGGHVAERIVRGNRRAEAGWTALPHSTFAVTDPATALSEGFAIHFETLWGHYGSTPERRAYYHRIDPVWTADAPIRSELLAPVRDIMTFSQNWARYQAVRDGLPAFEGHVYAGDYLRAQYDPARDRARLRNGSAMVASEGTVAAILFWIAQGTAKRSGAVEGRGLDQPGVLRSTIDLLAAVQRASVSATRLDVIDVVGNFADPGSNERRGALDRFVAITKGATSRGDVRAQWEELYGAAISLDLARTRSLAGTLAEACRDVVEKAMKDSAALRTAVGTILPVRLTRTQVALKAFGPPFPAEMDLNALGAAELQVLTGDPQLRVRIQRVRDEKPFESYDDFERRGGVSLQSLGATAVK